MNIAAGTIVEILFTQQYTDSLIAHVENPVRQAWSDILHVIGQELGIQQSLPFDKWLDQVALHKNEDYDAYPVNKLYEFFNLYFRTVSCGTVIMDTDNARKHSAKLRALKALDDVTVSGYVRYWRGTGYLL